ncbi:MAG: hypothetical protein WDN69_04745 [Aliidongia sp.]
MAADIGHSARRRDSLMRSVMVQAGAGIAQRRRANIAAGYPGNSNRSAALAQPGAERDRAGGLAGGDGLFRCARLSNRAVSIVLQLA